MNQENTHVRRALVSVSDKTGLIQFAQALAAQNIEILSTGGTAKLLSEHNVPVTPVEDITQFPEMMNGRLKTLHPKVHGGILGQRDKHDAIAKQHGIHWIDLVVVNLYPFEKTVKNKDIQLQDAIEQIDIGGPTMIRAAAKNMEWVCPVVDPNDYPKILKEIQTNNSISFHTRKSFAQKAFHYTANYDHVISQFLDAEEHKKTFTEYPETLNLSFHKASNLRYGENPHQTACAYKICSSSGILSAIQHQGKELSYNNIADSDAAIACVSEFIEPTAVIVKHGNPCGVALGKNIFEAFEQAYAADSLSAFGGIVALNRECDEYLAKMIKDIFFEVIIAPSYTKKALEVFSQKQNLRILENPTNNTLQKHSYKFVNGGVLIQDADVKPIQKDQLQFVTTNKPTEEALKSMLFAWPVVKHLKSNAILLSKLGKTVGIGTGQVSRVDAVDIALKKAGQNLEGSILASDAFFPFRDSIDRLAKTGIVGIIQPGGSMRDKEVIAACEEHNIPMVFTGQRCFNH